MTIIRRLGIIKLRTTMKGVFPMNEITVEKVKYGTWGDTIRVSNGVVEIYATLELGPRIIRYGFVGGPNEFFEDLNDEIGNEAEEIKEFFGNKGTWHIYGGHRLWTSPEILPRVYYPDNRKVDFEIIENGVRLIQEPQVENSVQLIMEVTMAEDGEVTAKHYVKNIGAWDIELAPWALTVLAVGGTEVVGRVARDNGFLHTQNLSLWTYTDMADERVKWGTKYIMLKTNDYMKNKFKVGLSNEDGYACYFNHGNMFIKKFEAFDPESVYPDNNVNYETFTAGVFTEIETLGKLAKIKPDETVCHIENWKLISQVPEPKTEEEIDEIIKKYVG